MAVTNFQVSIAKANWIDVNSSFTIDTLPDRVPDSLAISNSLYNLFNCPIGARGKIFEPTYGALWYEFLQEPIDDITAGQMRMAGIQAIIRWEPRLNLIYEDCLVQPDLTIPGYRVRFAGIDSLTGVPVSIQFVEIP